MGQSIFKLKFALEATRAKLPYAADGEPEE